MSSRTLLRVLDSIGLGRRRLSHVGRPFPFGERTASVQEKEESTGNPWTDSRTASAPRSSRAARQRRCVVVSLLVRSGPVLSSIMLPWPMRGENAGVRRPTAPAVVKGPFKVAAVRASGPRSSASLLLLLRLVSVRHDSAVTSAAAARRNSVANECCRRQ